MTVKITIVILYFFLLLFIFVPLFIAGLSLAPWVPVPKDVPDRVDRLAKLTPGQVFYEIGCGDSRVCRHIAMRNPKVKVIGIEMAQTMYLYSKMKLFFKPLKNLTIVHANALKQDLSGADAIYFYMLENTINEKLKPKLLKELAKGVKIISYACRFSRWQGKYVSDKPGKSSKALHMYII